MNDARRVELTNAELEQVFRKGLKVFFLVEGAAAGLVLFVVAAAWQWEEIIEFWEKASGFFR